MRKLHGMSDYWKVIIDKESEGFRIEEDYGDAVIMRRYPHNAEYEVCIIQYSNRWRDADNDRVYVYQDTASHAKNAVIPWLRW